VLAAMSGGVDSSVAAALLVEEGHEVVGATLKLWGGASDSGCCSVADVDDARRVADSLGIVHHVFNLTEVFEESVVAPYVREHAGGRTPNPCIECNRRVKFGALLDRARRMGFDVLATGHHARVVADGAGKHLLRGVDRAKDQSYVLAMLVQEQLEDVVFPVGTMTKSEVRAHAARLGLRTAHKPDSQDVCFIHSSSGRSGFLDGRIRLHRARVFDVASGEAGASFGHDPEDAVAMGEVPAVELLTLGQRRGLGASPDGRRRYVLSVDVERRSVVVGTAEQAATHSVEVGGPTWVASPLDSGARALAQTSAHATAAPCSWLGSSVRFDEPQRLVAPGQTVALYDARRPDRVLGSATAR
jgi:tRNA-specific 2-thiouridylase